MSNRTTDSQPLASDTRRGFLASLGVGVGAALAGCSSAPGTGTPSGEATVTVRLRNLDDREREFEVVVNQGDSVTDSFSGVLPADQERYVEMVATFRLTDEQYDFTITSTGGQRGRTWEPTECGDLLVDAVIEGGEPAFETECRSD